LVKTRFRDSQIELAHGSGGKATRRLVEGLILPYLANPALEKLSDSGEIDVEGVPLAFTTDSYVVHPLSFPGGSIGELAVNGTLNDLAVSAAQPLALVCTLIIEAGLPTAILENELKAIAKASKAANINVIAGDTKVVEHGQADGLYITTAGIGRRLDRVKLDPRSVCAGDRILISGPIGDHGITVLLARGELDLEADLRSDTRCVWPFVKALIDAVGREVRWMRDPTRGGVASALNELARDSNLGVSLDEKCIPMHDAVRAACEVLGLEPLHVANEGQFLAVVSAQSAAQALAAIKSLPGGEEAALIGEIKTEPQGMLQVITPHGATRLVDMLVGDQLPRIC
jgi:hydrogenase expression/formation protein HypE